MPYFELNRFTDQCFHFFVHSFLFIYCSGSETHRGPLTTEEQAVLVAINPENEILYSQTPSNPSPRSVTPINGDKENDINGFQDVPIKMPDKTVQYIN